MDFASKINYIRAQGWSDIEIAEEVSRASGQQVSRQRIYNYRTGKRDNPARYDVSIAILKLYKRLRESEVAA